ncbi:hypothetical protein ABZV78_03525 [Micromonospora sp. NPDC004540]|uniref:hypothetical protein n=1 Tax=Micromonospora sp. NPDC004540 TaxID=3154457 RepID=UPI0033BB41B1
MRRSLIRRFAGLCGLMLAAGLLTGCGEPAATPKDLCDLVGEALIAQIVPDAVQDPPYRGEADDSQQTGQMS